MESNYGTAIAALYDSLKTRANFSTNEKQNQNQAHLAAERDYSRALSKLHEIDRNSDWFIALLALVVITLALFFSLSFESRSIEKFANQSIGVERRK